MIKEMLTIKVIIIGSGIVGASAAYHLSRNGIDVTVIDANHEGRASAAGAGIVCPWITHHKHPDWYTLARRGALYYGELTKELENDGEWDIGYKQVGALAISKEDEVIKQFQAEAMSKRAAATPEVGDIKRLSGEEARGLFPLLNIEYQALYVSGGARVDAHLLCQAMQRASSLHGAQFVEGKASLTLKNGHVVGAEVNGELYACDQIIVTTGAWTNELLSPLHCSIAIKPQRGQIIHFGVKEHITSDWPVVIPDSSYYMLAFDDQRIVVGATRETGAGFDYRLTAGGVKEVIEAGLEMAASLENSSISEMRVGFRPMGPDTLPLLGKLQGHHNVTIATGLGPSGITMGPYIGVVASEIALNHTLPFDLTPYDPLR
ncbi:D-amino-acid dehydrogenase [Cytobacillus kochii]|nr:D-amino-acid dehydrogenase [Cytobacillus kochii]